MELRAAANNGRQGTAFRHRTQDTARDADYHA
jgi:hypothetical protein